MAKAAEQQPQPVVSGSQVFAAGIASTAAAFVTSRFGVAGTLLGAALTTMIITGGSAILRAYLENATGRVRKVRSRVDNRKAERYAEPPTMPGRPDLRDNAVGRMRAAAGWFANLPPLMRRPIIIKGLVGAAVAFVIGMGAVYAIERGIGNSLSCGLWGNCPTGATPGIHIGQGPGAGAGSSLTGGRADRGGGPDRNSGGIFGADQQNPLRQQDPLEQQDLPQQQNPLQQDPGFRSPSQQASPPASTAEPAVPEPEPLDPAPVPAPEEEAPVPSEDGAL